MTRIRTVNARRRARARHAPGCKVLQTWECYVDDFDARTVHLMMADLTADRGGEREYGSFPRRLLRHVDVKRGLFVTVDLLRCRRIEIRTLPLDPDAPDQAGRLIGLLRALRDDHDGRTRSEDTEDGMTNEKNCGLCSRTLDVPEDPMSRDCGGDCWGCIGQIEADAGYGPSVEAVETERAEGRRPA